MTQYIKLIMALIVLLALSAQVDAKETKPTTDCSDEFTECLEAYSAGFNQAAIQVALNEPCDLIETTPLTEYEQGFNDACKKGE